MKNNISASCRMVKMFSFIVNLLMVSIYQSRMSGQILDNEQESMWKGGVVR